MSPKRRWDARGWLSLAWPSPEGNTAIKKTFNNDTRPAFLRSAISPEGSSGSVNRVLLPRSPCPRLAQDAAKHCFYQTAAQFFFWTR